MSKRVHNAAKRRDFTHKLLRQDGHVTVSDLSDRLGVSEVTIRKDLQYLEKHNLLLRTHGGALLPDRFVRDRPFEEKAKRNADAKERIGKRAAALVEKEDTLILDAGTTTLQVAFNLQDKEELMVITNAVNVALELLRYAETIEVLILGGMVRPTSASIVGPHAEQIIREQACHKLFLGVDGFDLSHGLTTTNPMEAHINQLMIESVEQVIVVTDSTKFGRRGLSRICKVDAVDTVITDDEAPPEVVSALEEQDVHVELA